MIVNTAIIIRQLLRDKSLMNINSINNKLALELRLSSSGAFSMENNRLFGTSVIFDGDIRREGKVEFITLRKIFG